MGSRECPINKEMMRCELKKEDNTSIVGRKTIIDEIVRENSLSIFYPIISYQTVFKCNIGIADFERKI